MKRRYIFPPSCPDELFTDRDAEMELLYRLAMDAARRRTYGTALIGLRRLGKTELFKRVHARLFFEQETVVPFFFSYQGASLTSGPLACDYLQSFLRQYYAFVRRDERLLKADLTALLQMGMADESLDTLVRLWLERFLEEMEKPGDKQDEGEMLSIAFETPRNFAESREQAVVVFLDEFERVLEVRNRDGVDPSALGKYQVAVESLWCPHIITGSALTLILRDIVGAGPLYGRLFVEYLRGLHPVYGAELAKRVAAFQGVRISEEMAAHLAERTDGNPFYITAVVRQAATLGVSLDGPEELNRSLATDLIRGAIFSALWQQVMHFVMGENQYGVRSELVDFLAQYPMGERITERDMRRFGERVGLGAVEVHGLFAALARADLVEEGPLRMTYSAVRDPILNEFLGLWRRIEGSEPKGILLSELQEKYKRVVRGIEEYKRYVAEHVMDLLMTKWRGEEVEGEYFGVEGKVKLPRFDWVGKRGVWGERGKQVEMDVIGRYVGGAWIVESKYWERKVGLGEVQVFEERAEVARESLRVERMTLWYFGKSGFTAEAEEYMRERGILHSDEEQLNRLLREYGLRKLPKM